MVGVVVIAGTSSGVGKTTLSVGLMAALRSVAETVDDHSARGWQHHLTKSQQRLQGCKHFATHRLDDDIDYRRMQATRADGTGVQSRSR